MSEKVLEKLPSLTAEERQQLRQNCLRAIQRSRDALIVQEAKRVLTELDSLEKREVNFLVKLPVEQRIEYAFRRLPATDRERRAIRLLHEHQGSSSRVAAAWSETEPSSWRRDIAEICRNRRHLLSVGNEATDPNSSAELTDWADRLIAVGEDGSSVRLKPEAAAAFMRLGYVSERAFESQSDDARGLNNIQQL